MARRPKVRKKFDNREYYDAPKTISYGAHLTMVVTMRSRGKTYGFVKAAVKDWLRDGSQFVLVRRYVTELEEQFPRMFDALNRNDEFPNHVFKCTGMKAYIARKPENEDDKPDWQPLGYGIPLSKQANYKGSEYAYVKKIIFDEFIRVVKTPPGYLRDDVVTVRTSTPTCSETLVTLPTLIFDSSGWAASRARATRGSTTTRFYCTTKKTRHSALRNFKPWLVGLSRERPIKTL